MTTLRQLRKAALALPEVEEGTHFGMVAFEVRGKGFISVTKDGVAQLYMTEEEAAAVLERYPAVERLTRQGKPIGVRVPLEAVNGMQLNALVEKSWASRAPKRLVAQRSEARKGNAPSGPHALPGSIGKPATRALLAAGISDLREVATRSERQLLGLHGVGPRAIRILSAALAERGLSFERES